MLEIEYTSAFKKDLKLAHKRRKNITALKDLMKSIELEVELDSRHRDHALIGNWKHHRELHIESDWLLIYKIIPEEKVVIFVRTGTHSDLFN